MCKQFSNTEKILFGLVVMLRTRSKNLFKLLKISFFFLIKCWSSCNIEGGGSPRLTWLVFSLLMIRRVSVALWENLFAPFLHYLRESTRSLALIIQDALVSSQRIFVILDVHPNIQSLIGNVLPLTTHCGWSTCSPSLKWVVLGICTRVRVVQRMHRLNLSWIKKSGLQGSFKSLLLAS